MATFTAASHSPPKCGALGGIKLKSMPLFALEVAIFLVLQNFVQLGLDLEVNC